MTTDVGRPPGDMTGWPKLVVRYRTDPERVAALVPPGFEPAGDGIVTIGVYCVQVHGEPEHGISTRVGASFDGQPGQFSLGVGIDQESAIFISRETNGQPKFPCSVRYFRYGDEVVASALHQGVTFFECRGRSAGLGEPDNDDTLENEWWIKSSRAVGGGEGFDLPPTVVRVAATSRIVRRELLDADVTFRPSAWDPYTDLLPVEQVETVELVTSQFSARTISVAGVLDAEAFAPFADTIGGSRWPGERGGPRSVGASS